MARLSTPAIVLAAGGSTRCPGGKLLREFRGQPLLCWTLETLQRCEAVSSIFLVCGFQGESVSRVADRFDKVHPVFNSDWSEGLSTSLVCGILALPQEVPGSLVCLGDTPFFRYQTLLGVLPEEPSKEFIALPSHEGRHGHPKYFPRRFFPQLLNLRGDEGARVVLRRRREQTRIVEVDDPGILRDFDTLEDFMRVRH